MALKADVLVEGGGTVYLVRPLTPAAEAWLEENVGEGNGFQPYWPKAVVVEHRYIGDLVDGMRADGLKVA